MSLNYTQKKVFVGLSGGVDSAVSAALLKKEGYDVTGVFIKAWSPEGYPCTWREDRRSAMRAAAVLDIPFITLDLEKEYKKEVVDYMIREYKEGKTPNPDVMCNKQIKFGHFLKFALENGADFVATGHYARTVPKSPILNPSPKGKDFGTLPFGEGRVGLLEGSDKNKDQSYFLWTLTQDQLKNILFPIGHLRKSEVRKLARKFGLPQETRKDSQGVCFLGQIDMKEFLKEFVGAKPGKVLNEKGEVVGEHEGALLYTIGERHGFVVANKSTHNDPLYVVAKDVAQNTVIVAPKITPHLSQQQGSSLSVLLQDMNWISGKAPDPSKKYSCRLRYRQEKMGCRVEDNKIIFDMPQFGVSAGQSLVLYLPAQSGDREVCLGGGVIS